MLISTICTSNDRSIYCLLIRCRKLKITTFMININLHFLTHELVRNSKSTHLFLPAFYGILFVSSLKASIETSNSRGHTLLFLSLLIHTPDRFRLLGYPAAGNRTQELSSYKRAAHLQQVHVSTVERLAKYLNRPKDRCSPWTMVTWCRESRFVLSLDYYNFTYSVQMNEAICKNCGVLSEGTF